MGRSPMLLMLACASTLSLGSDARSDHTSAPVAAADDAHASIVFDASPYLRRMGGVDVALLPTVNGYAVTSSPPSELDSVQSVPLPPAVLGMASLGAGWILIRGVRGARRRMRR